MENARMMFLTLVAVWGITSTVVPSGCTNRGWDIQWGEPVMGWVSDVVNWLGENREQAREAFEDAGS